MSYAKLSRVSLLTINSIYQSSGLMNSYKDNLCHKRYPMNNELNHM